MQTKQPVQTPSARGDNSGHMSHRPEEGGSSASGSGERRYKGVRCRRWGKWVSEIRVPASRERLWLGSYATPEAAAVAHDTAVFFLRGPGSSAGLNFPDRVAMLRWTGLSPRSIQRAASDSGMAVDAQLAVRQPPVQPRPPVLESAVAAVDGAIDGRVSWGGGGDDYGLHVASDLSGELSVDDMDFYM